jgi:hypothetical protein
VEVEQEELLMVGQVEKELMVVEVEGVEQQVILVELEEQAETV